MSTSGFLNLINKNIITIFSARWFLLAILYVVLTGIFFDPSWIRTDDVFYYLVTSHNYINSGVPTFDGSNKTNGFHPLFFYLLSATLWLAQTTRENIPQVAALINAFIYGMSYGPISKIIGPSSVKIGIFFHLTMFIVPGLIFPIAGIYVFSWIEGTEFSLSFLLFSCFVLVLRGVFCCDQLPNDLKKQFSILIILSILLFFSRTDTPVITMPCILYVYYNRHCVLRGFYTSRFAALPILGVCIVVVYLISNYREFGYFQQISGVLKSYHANLGGDGTFNVFYRRLFDFVAAMIFGSTVIFNKVRHLEPEYLMQFLINLVGFIFSWYAFCWFILKRKNQWMNVILIGMFSYLIAHLFRGWIEVRYWYFAPFFLVFYMSIVNLTTNNRWLLYLTVVIGCLKIFFAYPFSDFSDNEKIIAVKNVIRGYCSNGSEIILAAPNAGRLSFDLNVPVINLDGLINSAVYFEYVKAGKMKHFLSVERASMVIIPHGYLEKAPYNQLALEEIAFSDKYFDYLFMDERCK